MNTPPAVDMTPSALMITPLVTPAALLTTPPASKTTPAASKTKPAASKTTPLALKTKPPVSKSTQPPPSSSKLATPLKLKLKGQLGPVPPPDCCVCLSQYKLITELRGFMCLCSPVVAQGLKNLKKKKKKNWRRIKEKSKTSKSPRDLQNFSKVSKTRPASSASKVVTPFQRTHRQSDDFILDRFSPAPSSTTCSPQKDKPEPPPDPPHGKLVIMVEDFYYGCDPGRKSFKSSALDRIYAGPYRCIHCPMSLRNNIKLMSHMKQHVSMMSQEKGDLDCVCPHCFRRFLSPFKLQCHLEAVHSQYQSTAKCKICELEFGSEASFLWHMKSTHKPGEMPYICQVCNFRSSFYSDIWSHFHQVHADTKYLLCQYCLRVMRSNTCYQQHFARHQRKHVFGCDKCRLHFLYLRERIEHKLYHGTHIRPPQLIGLKPGTKVTVRTYSVVRGSENEEELKKTVVPCKVVEVDPPPPTQEAPKRKPVTRLGPLLSTITQESVSCPSQLCVECLSAVQNFETHFPSLVHCSLCRFITCCSTSYANHMINNHATCRKNPPYLSIFQSEPGLSQTLRCVSCEFTTCRGDVMANHLTERPEHCCIILTQNELRVNGAETQNQQPTHNSHSVISSVSGAFIPIHLIPSGQTSTQLSVKQLTSPTPLSSLPAMSIKFLGPRLQPDRCLASPLLANQLSAVLSSLCYGLPQACRCHQTSPLAIQSWIRLQEHHLSDRKWCWRTDKLAEWVLNQREQQFSLSEDVLLQTARTALGEDSQLVDCYSWIVDFMLRHELSLQPTNNSDQQQQQHYRGRLPKSVRDNSRTFIHSLSTQIQSRRIPPQRVGSMDEFSIFIDSECFLKQNPLALQLFGSPEQEPVFDIILSGLFEGTFLPPLLFFRGTPSHIPEGFPENILLEARQEGFTDQERLDIWIDKVWRPHLASQSNSESLLMVDIHHGHLTDEFRRSLTSVSTGVAFIPSGCSCRLQPIDVCVMPVLRDFLQAQWTQLVSEGGLDGLGLDQLALTVACWLSEVSSTLNSEKHILRRSFASVCNLQQVEDRRDAMKMITALTEALVQPLETSGPPPQPEPQLELLLVMEEEVMEAERKEDMEQDPEKVVQDPEEVELLIKSPSALHQVFNGDGEQESFHGFMDD